MTLLEDLRSRLRPLGFDRIWPAQEGGRLSFIVGNTRALWPIAGPIVARAPGEHPLDRHTERSLAPVHTLPGVREIVFAHQDPPPPIQAIAAGAAGLSLAPCGMVVDEVFGLWIALRAIVRTDLESRLSPARPSPCEGCSAPCREALETAMATRPLSEAGVGANWRAWLAVRDACPVGRQHRYSDEQIAYHYRRERCSKK